MLHVKLTCSTRRPGVGGAKHGATHLDHSNRRRRRLSVVRHLYTRPYTSSLTTPVPIWLFSLAVNSLVASGQKGRGAVMITIGSPRPDGSPTTPWHLQSEASKAVAQVAVTPSRPPDLSRSPWRDVTPIPPRSRSSSTRPSPRPSREHCRDGHNAAAAIALRTAQHALGRQLVQRGERVAMSRDIEISLSLGTLGWTKSN